eukprot:symbB.v1.2.013948.t2/scaffold1003.1/size206925/8
MTEGNAEAIVKYIQSVLLVLPAQKRSLVKAMFSNQDGRRRFMREEAFVARISPDTRHCNACVPPWAGAASHLEKKFMKLHAVLVAGEETLEATLHSVMTAMLASPVLGQPQATHMQFEDHVQEMLVFPAFKRLLAMGLLLVLTGFHCACFNVMMRRDFFMLGVGMHGLIIPLESKAEAPRDPGRDVTRFEDNLLMTELPSGLKYADVRLGTGASPKDGTKVTIDYVMMTTGARYGNKIDSTKDREAPYSFVVGDESIIKGLSEAVASMREGGIRRIVIPQRLGFTDESKQPVPPNFAEFQRFRNIYLNPNRVYQPDLVMDVKLFQFSK